MKPSKEIHRPSDIERKCVMLNEFKIAAQKILYHPMASVICLLLAFAVDCVFRPIGLALLAVPYVALLTVFGIISLILNFYRVDNRIRVLAAAACILLLVLFMVEMVIVVETFGEDHELRNSGYSEPISDDGRAGDHGGYDGGWGSGSHEDREDHPTYECGFCDGTRKCHSCNGRGGNPCTACHNGRCKHCHGSGTSTGYGTTGRCGACRGTGDCSICDGTGTRECGICYGNGKCRHC